MKLAEVKILVRKDTRYGPFSPPSFAEARLEDHKAEHFDKLLHALKRINGGMDLAKKRKDPIMDRLNYHHSRITEAIQAAEEVKGL